MKLKELGTTEAQLNYLQQLKKTGWSGSRRLRTIVQNKGLITWSTFNQKFILTDTGNELLEKVSSLGK